MREEIKMYRREEMTLSDFINAAPTNCDYEWYDLLDLDFGFAEAGDDQEKIDAASAAESAFIRANSNRAVSVYWPAHCMSRKISGDCTCSFAD